MNSSTSATSNAPESSNATAIDANITAAPSSTPTSAGGTSALGDDVSTPSTSSTAALSTLTTCMQSIVVGDVAYAQCVMNSGLFALNETQPANLRRQLRNTSSTEGALLAYLRTQLSNEQLRTKSIGMCRLQCTAPSFHASSSCCGATAQLRACQLTEATQTPTLVTCKQALDASLAYSNQECRVLSQQDTALIGITGGIVVAAVVASCVGLSFHRARHPKNATRSPKQDQDHDRDEQDGALLAWLRQVGILVWKNVVLRVRKPVALVVEQLVPLLFVAALVVLANLDTLFGRNSNALYRTSTQASTSLSTSEESPLLCLSLAPLSATDLGAPNATLRSFYSSGQSVLGLFFLLSFIKFVSSTTAAMVHEKEIKMREMMKIVGVSNSALLVSWSSTSTLLSLPVVCVLSALLKFGNVFPTTPFAVVLLVFWSLSVATVAFAYALAPCFRKSRTAAICSVLVWLLLFFPFFVVQPKTTSGAKYAAALLAPPTAFALAVDRLLREAQLGTGFAYSMTAAVQKTAFDGVPTAAAMSSVLLLDALWLLAIGWYLEQVLPQQFGVRKHWLFVLQRDYWRSRSAKLKPSATAMATAPAHHAIQSPSLYALASPRSGPGHGAGASGTDSHHYAASLTPLETPTVLHINESTSSTTAVVEPVSAELWQQERTGASLQLRSLTKVFTLQDGEQKRAVDSLSLTFYSGQITSLLGHNGAGKTTTISLLTGLVPPTAGDALLFGRSLQHESDAFRRIMGVCPQHDVLFPELSVHEHLTFFAVLKRIHRTSSSGSSSWVQELLDDVGLAGSQHVLSKNLSGGQKRKLSVALALLGDSKLVFFDEPTSGMDPYSRRFTWELLRRKRAGRVIVLTTHFMDEADVLGDRIAILADGKLRCVGSSLFLKTRYGAGYNLTMIKTPTFQISVVQHFLESYLGAREATLASESGSEVVFTLPTHTAPRFPLLFDALDAEMHTTLGIRNYGISVTTLEDVFLRIAHERDDHSDSDSAVPQPQPLQLQPPPPPQPQPLATPPTFASQFRTLLLKRWWISRRDKKALVNAIGIPLLFLVLVATLPEIQVASFLPDYATSFASPAQQQTCPALSITANRLDATTYTRCMERGYGFCSLGIIDCDARACCDAANVVSPFYPCSTCPVSATASSTAQPCYSGKCMRRNGAKLQIALNAFVTAMVVMLAFAFVPAATIAFVVKEREPHQDAKALQWISGMSLHAYWASNFVHDLAVVSVPVVAALVATPLANRALRSESEELLAMALLVVAHALCLVPVSYLYARRFQQHASAQTSMLVFALSSGGLLSIFSFLCRVVDFSMSRSLTLSGLDRDYLRWVFLLFPGYALNNGIFEIATRKITRGSLFGYWSRNANPQASLFGLFTGFGKNPQCVACWNRNLPGCCVRGALDFDVALAPILYMVVEAVVVTVLLVALETRKRRTPTRSTMAKTHHNVATGGGMGDTVAVDDGEDDDDDVAAERTRLDQQLSVARSEGDQNRAHHDNDDGNAIVIRHLHHKYSDDRVALRDLSLAIPRGQCFGYLGVNGAGKSTTIKVLTQQVVPTSGSVSVAGRDMVSNSYTRQQSLIGYCPQFDALHDLLTVEQELLLYARLKGISSPETAVRRAIQRLGLDEYAHKLTRGLSGGNKRKVSTAIALLGAPRIVVLDEPSTGMDPSARRKMWTVIAETCAQHQTSVLLTTHSMEECEALCSRVGILVKGKLTCLGSVQHLRDKFGRGFTVDVTLQREASADHVAAMERRVRDELLALGEDEALQELSERQVEQLCVALGGAQRGVELNSATSEWWRMPAAADGGSGSGSAVDGRVMAMSTFCAWWLAQLRSGALGRFLPQRFPGTTLVEKHGDHVRFHIPKQHGDEQQQQQLRPKEIFEVLERGKTELFIQEYSVSDTSLEHIFNRMADQGDKSNRKESGHHVDQQSSHTSESD